MRTITVEEAVRALNEAVASKGYDYIDPDAAAGNSCRNVKYTPDGDLVPSCIVGTALVWLGVPVEWFREQECETHSIHTLSADLKDTGTLGFTEDALEILGSEEQVNLLISDVVMPVMDGPAMVREARKTHPEVPILFMSGYAEEQLRKSIDIEHVAFLPKPFSMQELAEAVRAVLIAEGSE